MDSPDQEAEQVAPAVKRPAGDGVQEVTEALKGGPKSIDEITQGTGLPASVVGAALSLLEIRGDVNKTRSKKYKLTGKGKGKGATWEPNDDLYYAQGAAHRTLVRTLDQLLEITETDLETWTVDDHIVETWGVTMKGPDGEPTMATNFLVKAWLSKRVPEAQAPVIRPVTIDPGRLEVETGDRILRDYKVALYLPDPQFGFIRNLTTNALTPFHDRRALSVALQIAARVMPDVVVWGGDVLDLPAFSSKFIKKPGFYWTIQSAVIEAHWWLTQFRQVAPQADHYLLEGNHDMRLQTAIMDHLAAAYALKAADALRKPPALSVPNLLGLDGLGIEYVGDYPNGQVWLNDNIACEHGDTVSGTPGGTAGKIVKQADHYVIFGHVHRREMATRTIHGRNEREIEAVCPGCLCRIDGAVPGKKKRQNWQQGIAVIQYTENAKIDPDIQIVRIKKGRALYNGTLYTGRNPVNRMAKATQWPAFVDPVPGSAEDWED